MSNIMKCKIIFICIYFLLLATGCDNSNTETGNASAVNSSDSKSSNTAVKQEAQSNKAAYKTINWEDLVPKDYRPDELLREYQEKYNIDQLDDNDPIVEEAQARLKEILASAPVDESLSGQAIKLPGYLLPLNLDEKGTTEFLLVPYFGACIHVPPPPANQTIYTISTKPIKSAKLFDPVWVSGTIKAEHKVSQYADAGYTLTAQIIEEYQITEEEYQNY